MKSRNRSFIKEFVIKTPISAKNIQEEAMNVNILLGTVEYDNTDSMLLLAFTEKRNKNDIDKLIKFLSNY